jgi:hypothetical protein
MKTTSVAVNYHWDGHEPRARATFELSGKEVIEALLKHVEEIIKKPGSDAYNVYVDCPECGKNIGVDDLKVSLVVNFYG